MTTLRDLLNDFAKEIQQIPEKVRQEHAMLLDDDLPDAPNEEDRLNELIDEYIETIKERILG